MTAASHRGGIPVRRTSSKIAAGKRHRPCRNCARQREEHTNRPRLRLHQVAVLRHAAGDRPVTQRVEHVLPELKRTLSTKAFFEEGGDRLEIGVRDRTATNCNCVRSRDTGRPAGATSP